jgi:phenylalanyl-tRNA synthetase beta chain
MPTIITRLAEPGEELETLDGVKRRLDPFTILVCDARGALSIGGVMGGAESEVDANSKNILLEAAAWEYINIRRTMASQHLTSEAGYRFSRGVHPAQAIVGLRRAIELMRELGGGDGAASRGGGKSRKSSTVPHDDAPQIARGIIDQYPGKPKKIGITLPVAEVKRQLGVEIPAKEIARLLESLEFKVKSEKHALSKGAGAKVKSKQPSAVSGRRSEIFRVTVPEHRLDVDGTDDLIEEIARMYGYENIPISRMNDELPPQRTNIDLEQEELVRDILIDAGLQDVITYRFTTPEREALLTLPGSDAASQGGFQLPSNSAMPRDDASQRPAIPAHGYVRIENPISADRAAMRQTLLPGLLDLAAANLRYRARIALFEIGPVYWQRGADDVLLPREVAAELPEDEDRDLPLERRRLGIIMTGPREEIAWSSDPPISGGQGADTKPLDFYDFKGVVEALLEGLHLGGATFAASNHPSFHLGRAASLKFDAQEIGVFGELHPILREKFDLPAQPVLIGEFDLDALLARVPSAHKVKSLSRYPAVVQDLALVVDENVAADRVHALITQTAGELLHRAVLFDVYRGDQIPRGKKSLAYALTFQAADRTLSDADATKVREKIAARLRRELDVEVRGA